jgi:protein SCO1/2
MTGPKGTRAIAVALLWIGVFAPPHADEARPPLLQSVAIEQKLGQQIPLDLVFRDESGKAVRLGDLFAGRPTIVNLVYYRCPMLCTEVLNGLVASLETLSFDAGKEFSVVTVSIDPRETPDLASAKKDVYLKRYGRAGASAGWHFLTGDEKSVARLADAVGFRYAYDPELGQYAHAAGIFVATPDGRLARYFYGIDYGPRDLRLALVEASKGKIGTLADQIVLFCYQYDPTTGKYGATILGVMRVGGVVTVLALATFILVMWRREKRGARAGAA